MSLQEIAKQKGGPWSIILAGGEGERIRPFVHRWLKKNKPKQYCTFVGTRSMLQHTLARADLVSDRERQITVIRRSHLSEARPQFLGRSMESVVLQPENYGTGAGVFLPLTYIRIKDPFATVVIQPSDHFIHPEREFVEIVRSAVQTAEIFPDRLILLGVVPDSPEPDYGWMIPGEDVGLVEGRKVKNVRTFVEKPTRQRAISAMSSGGVWNTLISAVKVQTLWEMGLHCFPDMMPLFEKFGGAIGTPAERSVLDEIYRGMPECNFSAGLIERMVQKVSFIEMNGIFWSDWGRPERIGETLQIFQKTPAFPLTCLLQAKGPGNADSGERKCAG